MLYFRNSSVQEFKFLYHDMFNNCHIMPKEIEAFKGPLNELLNPVELSFSDYCLY